MATVQEALPFAFDLQREGRFAEADSVYGQVLDVLPGHSPALHLRGLPLAQCGRLEEGCALVEQAIAGDGAQPDMHANHASLLEALARAAADPAVAEQALRAAAALMPDSAAIRTTIWPTPTCFAAIRTRLWRRRRWPAIPPWPTRGSRGLRRCWRSGASRSRCGPASRWGEQGVGDEVMFANPLPLLTQVSMEEAQSST